MVAAPNVAPHVAENTLPIFSPDAPPRKRKRKGWAPDDTDHTVYQWVRFDGQSQSWVASALGLSQPTVSRILHRYEKWQAHATPAVDGRLSHAEQQRAQRWLTYQRNEIILARSLRMAGEMERPIELSKNVTSRPIRQPTAEHEFRVETAVVDRSAIALRFLRLAHRINMDQQKLVDKEPLADLPPLSEEEVAEQEADAAAVAEERAAIKQQSEAYAREAHQNLIDSDVALRVETEVKKRMAAILAEMQAEAQAQADAQQDQADAQQEQAAELPIRPSAEAATLELNLHNLHNCMAPPVDASADAEKTYEPNRPPEAPAENACLAAGELQNPNQWPGYSASKGSP